MKAGKDNLQEKPEEVAVDAKLVDTLASLSAIELSPGERSSLKTDLQDIVSYVEMLRKLDLQNVDITETFVSAGNNMRNDVIQEGLSQEEVLQNAPETHGSFIKAPPIIERQKKCTGL